VECVRQESEKAVGIDPMGTNIFARYRKRVRSTRTCMSGYVHDVHAAYIL
jgi:hypothetical protein